MNHSSDIKMTDLIFGPFVCQVSSRFNQALYLGSSLYIANREWHALQGVVDMNGALLFGALVLTYLVMIVGSVFLLTSAFGVISALSRKGLLGKRSFEFRDDGFVEKTDFSESLYAYSSIDKVFKRFGAIYIGLPGMNWQILPRRDFASAGARDDLYHFLKGKQAA